MMDGNFYFQNLSDDGINFESEDDVLFEEKPNKHIQNHDIEVLLDTMFRSYSALQIRFIEYTFHFEYKENTNHKTTLGSSLNFWDSSNPLVVKLEKKLVLCLILEGNYPIRIQKIQMDDMLVCILHVGIEFAVEAVNLGDQLISSICKYTSVLRSKPGFVPNWNIQPIFWKKEKSKIKLYYEDTWCHTK